MDMFTVIAFIVYSWGMYRLGKSVTIRSIGDQHIKDTLAKAVIPIGVLEKVDGNYYLYEKDSTNFLCQAEKLEDIPINLYSNKKISLALILYPEEASDQKFWCIHGKLKSAQ